MESSTKASLCSRGIFQLPDPDVDACRGSGEGVSSGVSSVVRELTDLGVGVRRGIERGSQSRVLDETKLTNPSIDARRGIR